MHHHLGSRSRGLLLALLFTALLVVACGGSNANTEETEGDQPAAAAVPTMPRASFTAVAVQSVLTRTGSPTSTTGLTATAEVTASAATTTTASATADPATLERGARAYERNGCAECHGAAGEGVAGQAAAIAGTTLSEVEFTDVLRTGGGLGNSHIFGPSDISPGGMSALYAYVQSLGSQ
jgi:mono/diheme cytochrome c family protein